MWPAAYITYIVFPKLLGLTCKICGGPEKPPKCGELTIIPWSMFTVWRAHLIPYIRFEYACVKLDKFDSSRSCFDSQNKVL